MKLEQLLTAVRQRFEHHAIPDAPLEAEIIARHVLGIDRAELHAWPERPVSADETAAIEGLAERRVYGEPSAYITGHRWFYGLDFHVGHGVLIPRPETELLVEVADKVIQDHRYRTVADIGTGSGVIAVCLAHLLPDLNVIATDISEEALDIARVNAGLHGVTERVLFCQGDLLAPLTGPVDLICANLPYVQKTELYASESLSQEPRLALDGGPDGLDVFRSFFPQVTAKLRPAGSLVIEVGAGQAKQIFGLMERVLPHGKFISHRDMAGHERVIEYRLTV